MENMTTFLDTSATNYKTCETDCKIENIVLQSLEVNLFQSTPLETKFRTSSSETNGWILSASYIYNTQLQFRTIRFFLENKQISWSTVTYFLSIVDRNGIKRFVAASSIQFNTQGNQIGTISDQIFQIDPTLLLLNGDLRLHCEIVNSPLLLPLKNISVAEEIPFPNIEGLSDVTIAVGEKEIKAHKVFLAVRSPVFLAMFESDMIEQKQNRVVIADIEYEVVKQMIHYIYTGKTPKLSEMADRLLFAAEKYSLDALKKICEKQLMTTISIDTVIQLMALADVNNATLLKEQLNNFIVKNIQTLIQNPSWQKLLYDGSYKQAFKEEP